MKKLLKTTLIFFFGILIFFGFAFVSDKSTFTEWEITNKNVDSSQISWAKFIWVNKNLNGKYFKKVAINLPCKIENLPYIFTFQLDLGADLTGMYENNISSFFKTNPNLKNKIKRLKNSIQFWNSKKSYNNLSFSFGEYTATNRKSYLYNNYGEKIDLETLKENDTIRIGTIGADLFQNKVLIIDYPNQRIAICDKVPTAYNKNLINIELDKHGRVILPYKSKGNNYRIMFDTGASLFPITALSKNRKKFTESPIIDSIEVTSSGKKHILTGRMINDFFELGGIKFTHQKVYENYTNYGIDLETDGMTGNCLFWNNIVVIDFKNKKFGIK